MNEKERIIELVKQNVISMEEALDLLEAASNNDTLSESTNTTDEETTQTTQATDDTEKETEASINQTLKRSLIKEKTLLNIWVTTLNKILRKRLTLKNGLSLKKLKILRKLRIIKHV